MSGAALRGFGRAYLKRGGSPAWTRSEGKSKTGGLNEKCNTGCFRRYIHSTYFRS